MTDSQIAAGQDAWVLSTSPDTPHPEPKKPRLTAAVAEVLLHMPVRRQVLGRSVSSALLSCPVRGVWAAQTLTVALVTEEWSPRTATWNNPPATGTDVSELQPALAAGERFEVDVTALAQEIAAGGDNYGFLVSTDSAADNRLYGFDSGAQSWRLDLEFADPPEAPVPLAPLGGAVAVEPVVSWDFIAADEGSEQVAARVWVNTSPTQTGAADSGWVANALPEFDLTAMPGWTPVEGTTYYWQVQVSDGGVDDSEVSDWAEFTYREYPVLTVTNPATGVVWDPSPTIAFEVGSGVVQQFRVAIYSDATGGKRYDSGWTTNGTASVTHAVPLQWNGKRIHVDDRTYRLEVRVRDRLDRVASGTDPGYVSSTSTYVMDDDATPTPPTGLVVAQIGDGPGARWTFTRASGVTRAIVYGRGNLVLGRLDADDVENVGTAWSFETYDLPAYETQLCWVKVVDDGTGKQTAPSDEAAYRGEIEGVWLVAEDGSASVQLDGVDVDGFRNSDQRAIYSPLGLGHDVDIVYALRGLTGTFVGGIDSTRGRDWEADLATLRAMRSATDERVRLAYGTVNVPVILRDVSPGLPSPDLLPSNMRHTVTFTAHQVDELGDD